LNEKAKLEIEKFEAEQETATKSSKDKSSVSVQCKAPNKDFEAGKFLPKKYFNKFPLSLAGVPIEEVDDFYKTDYVKLNF
jgi:hypothetical protein